MLRINLLKILIESTDTRVLQIIFGKIVLEAWPIHPVSGWIWPFLELRGSCVYTLLNQDTLATQIKQGWDIRQWADFWRTRWLGLPWRKNSLLSPSQPLCRRWSPFRPAGSLSQPRTSHLMPEGFKITQPWGLINPSLQSDETQGQVNVYERSFFSPFFCFN